MRRLILVVLVSFAVLAIPTVTAGQDPAPQEPTATAEHPPPQPVPAKATLRNGCAGLFTQRQFKRYARKVYLRTEIKRKARKRMRLMVRCQHSAKAERKMRKFRKAQAAARRYRARVASVTPFAGPNGTRWAIPWSIIACESGGSWSAYNGSSGARGPYQFLGWNVPWPVRTAADRLAHHRMAARLWAGGSGRSHWVC